MDVRVITLRYQDGVQGFPEEALRKAISGREVLEVREHFFIHANVPHMALLVTLGDGVGAGTGSGSMGKRQEIDPGEQLPEDLRGLYKDLKRWRNDKAKADGKPAYAIARNVQLAEICKRQPHSLAELKEVDGIGEAMCRDYGAAILGMMPEKPVEK